MTEKPETRPIDIAYLPDELCNMGRFCNWRYEWKDERWTKVPYNPRTGRRADSTDPATFADLDAALDAEHNHDGVGVGLFGNLAAIDIDHCVDDAGNVSEMAQDIIKTMNTYTEKSPSRTGIRLLCTVPDGFDYDNKQEFYQKNTRAGLEIYVAGKTDRFVTLTGDALTEDADLAERGDELRDILDRYMRRPATDAKTHDTSIVPTGYTDEEIFNELTGGGKYANLFVAGDISDYESQSEADLALCLELARWTGRDPARIDELFRMSALYRDKWERQDYRENTIDKAIKFCDGIFIKGDADVVQKSKQDTAPSFTAYPVGKYILGDQFARDVDYFKQYKDRKTGFKNLDEYLTLYPGICAFGGAASLGKTTFCVNLADNLVRSGETVLYFSLEQEPIELVTKSLTRRMYDVDPDHKPVLNNVNIKDGETSPALERVKRDYAATANNFIIVRCSFLTTAQEICDYIEEYIETENVRPVVFIDYLQLISPPPEFKGDQRAAIDHNIKLFKTVQLKNELFLVLVSSFNRAGYDTPVSYSDFKESGMIEYTADYILGLQLKVVTEHDFMFRPAASAGRERMATAQEKQEMIDAALNDPKGVLVQLVSRKNRNGKQNFTCNFNYVRWYDVFEPLDETTADRVPVDWRPDDHPTVDDPDVVWN